jgi:hypothetical protein
MISRRHFMQSAAAVGIGLVGLRRLVRAAEVDVTSVSDPDRFGPLLDDPHRILDLPEGFSYRLISKTGDPMDDGLRVPGLPDGMAAFPVPSDYPIHPGSPDHTILVRNHELTIDRLVESPFGRDASLLDRIDRSKLYDDRPALGGTSTIIFNTRTGLVEGHFLSLAGTVRNCAGGPTPWGSWITCEEDVSGPNQGYHRSHGYNFEVPTGARGLVQAVPLVHMGRFNHEAVAIDPRTGIVYQTEDRNDGLIYRFIPDSISELHRGGRLEALCVKGRPSLDLRNWTSPAQLFVGETVETQWVPMRDVESPDDSLRLQGFASGAARFARAEGMWFGRGSIFFACTNGGRSKKGQIWRYVPSAFEGSSEEAKFPGRLELFVEPNDGNIVNNADNLCVAPSGDVFVAEDGAGPNRLLCVSRQGRVSTFASNAWNRSELAGVCFSPDGSTLFVNIQHDPGMTLAITGRWPA